MIGVELEDTAGRITAALIATRNIGAPEQAVAMLWQVRRLLAKGEPGPALPPARTAFEILNTP